MEIVLGIAIALAVGFFVMICGFDRDRSLYPVIVIVIASYYELFAVIGGGTALGQETAAFAVFVAAAVIGFRTSLWIVVAALAAHGLFDWFHGGMIDNPGVPQWWPLWCLSFDLAAAVFLAWRIRSAAIAA